jgi:hypothetical protein
LNLGRGEGAGKDRLSSLYLRTLRIARGWKVADLTAYEQRAREMAALRVMQFLRVSEH